MITDTENTRSFHSIYLEQCTSNIRPESQRSVLIDANAGLPDISKTTSHKNPNGDTLWSGLHRTHLSQKPICNVLIKGLSFLQAARLAAELKAPLLRENSGRSSLSGTKEVAEPLLGRNEDMLGLARPTKKTYRCAGPEQARHCIVSICWATTN